MVGLWQVSHMTSFQVLRARDFTPCLLFKIYVSRLGDMGFAGLTSHL